MFLCPNSRQKYKLRSPPTWTLPSECIPRELSFESSQASTKFIWQFRIVKFLGLDKFAFGSERIDWLLKVSTPYRRSTAFTSVRGSTSIHKTTGNHVFLLSCWIMSRKSLLLIRLFVCEGWESRAFLEILGFLLTGSKPRNLTVNVSPTPRPTSSTWRTLGQQNPN